MVESRQSHAQVESGSNRSFGIVFAVVFAIIGLWPLLSGELPRWWSMAIATAFLLFAVVAPGVLAPLNRLWFLFGMLLNRIISPVVMFLVFAVTVVPTGLIFRLLGKDPLRLRLDPAADSYWLQRDEERIGSMKDQF